MNLKNILITRAWLREHGACYYDTPEGTAKADAVIPAEGLTLETLLRDERVPDADKVWVCTRKGLLPSTMLWEVAASALERRLAEAQVTDPRSLAVVTLLRRLAAGEDVPNAEMVAAWAAAWSAAAWSAAARAASWAARSAAAAAAYTTAMATYDAVAAAAAYFKKLIGVSP